MLDVVVLTIVMFSSIVISTNIDHCPLYEDHQPKVQPRVIDGTEAK